MARMTPFGYVVAQEDLPDAARRHNPSTGSCNYHDLTKKPMPARHYHLPEALTPTCHRTIDFIGRRLAAVGSRSASYGKGR